MSGSIGSNMSTDKNAMSHVCVMKAGSHRGSLTKLVCLHNSNAITIPIRQQGMTYRNIFVTKIPLKR